MTSAAKHTAGPWRTDPEVEHQSVLAADGVLVADCAIFVNPKFGTRTDAINAANARLIAEAGTILHETGLTPRQLADAYTNLREGGKTAVEAWKVERAELIAALAGVTELYCELANSGDAGFWNPEKVDEVIAARAALSKAQKGGV